MYNIRVDRGVGEEENDRERTDLSLCCVNKDTDQTRWLEMSPLVLGCIISPVAINPSRILSFVCDQWDQNV